MFACIFFEEDKSLSVVNECDKSLEMLHSFKSNESVRMKWGRKIYNGTIVNVSDNEEQLQKFASKAYKAVLEGLSSDTNKEEIVQLLMNFEIKKTSGKRQHVISDKLKESKEQEQELSPKKKKIEGKKSQKTLKSKNTALNVECPQQTQQDASEGVTIGQRETDIPVSNLLCQFTSADLHVPVTSIPCDKPAVCNKVTYTSTTLESGLPVAWPQQLNPSDTSPATCILTPSTSSIVLESQKPVIQQPQQAQANLYTESVRLYRQAVDTLEENDSREGNTA
ncbi:uncharacterized protein LOC132744786 [Ruditapes philippinarum]|uniref:uncharacterized protein LOC132744786 n=1 Tax=Ruditapes philippinarum TaxID=129788 RepID=UPI00295AAF7A|nr:uncharacterized protein LOC132744786 [Ruditapes philippinarum]